MGGGSGAPPGSGPGGAVLTVAELLATAEVGSPSTTSRASRGATLYRVRRGDERFVVKYLDPARDWTMRASGVLGGPSWPLWTRGMLDRLPGSCINQPTSAVALERTAGRPGSRTAVLMRDVGAALIPSTDEPIPPPTHQLLTHMAALHATFWQAGPEFDVVPAMHRYLELSPWTALSRGRDRLDAPGARS